MADPSTYRPAPGEIPTSPGVYRFKDARGRVIYVGKAKNLRARLSSYFQDLSNLHARTAGMVICPCSMGTLAAVSLGTSRSLVERAADVTLKERRPLLLVTREMPLSVVHLENMLRATRAGAIVLPASPGFYHRPTTIDQLVDFVVARVLDLLGVEYAVGRRWGDTPPEPADD